MNYKIWCDKHGLIAMPATPKVVGAYLGAAGEGYAMPTLRRRVAAIARVALLPTLSTRHFRGIGRKHGCPPRRAVALTTAEVRKVSQSCGTGLADACDRALIRT